MTLSVKSYIEVYCSLCLHNKSLKRYLVLFKSKFWNCSPNDKSNGESYDISTPKTVKWCIHNENLYIETEQFHNWLTKQLTSIITLYLVLFKSKFWNCSPKDKSNGALYDLSTPQKVKWCIHNENLYIETEQLHNWLTKQLTPVITFGKVFR